MKRIVLSFVLVLLILSLILGCTPTPAPTPTPTPAPTPAPSPAPPPAPKAETLVLLSLPPGTSFYSVLVIISQIVNTHTDIKAVVRPVTNPAAMRDLLLSGEGSQTVWPADALNVRYNGLDSPLDPRAKGKTLPHMRILFTGNYLYYGCVTHTGTGIKTIPDLKGKSMAGRYPTLSACTQYARYSMSAYGLDPDKDVKILEYAANVPALVDLGLKKIDAAYVGLGGAKMVELDAKLGVILVPFDQQKIDVLQKNVTPYVTAVNVPTYIAAVHKETPGIGVRQIQICDERHMSDDTAYLVVKSVMEHAEEFKAVATEFYEYGKDWALMPNFPVPYHPGAIKYLKEAGIWTNEAETQQQKLLKELPK